MRHCEDGGMWCMVLVSLTRDEVGRCCEAIVRVCLIVLSRFVMRDSTGCSDVGLV